MRDLVLSALFLPLRLICCDIERDKLMVLIGQTFESFVTYLPQKQQARIANSPDQIQSQLDTSNKDQSVSEYQSFIERIRSTLPTLCAHGPVKETSTPVLWNIDLSFNNIFVDGQDPTKITSVLDWQLSHINPLFMQARFPQFLEPPKGWKYMPFPAIPALPDDFESLNEEEKEKARQTLYDALLSKYYELSTRSLENKQIITALSFDRRLWEPFTYCQLHSHGSLVPNINTLIRLRDGWSKLGLPGECPYVLTEEELKRHFARIEGYDVRQYVWETVLDALGTDETGWVANERFNAVRKAHKKLWKEFVKMVVKDAGEMTEEKAREVWPFPPTDVGMLSRWRGRLMDLLKV